MNAPGNAAAGGEFNAKNGNAATNYFRANPYGGLRVAAISAYNYQSAVLVIYRI